MSMLNGYSVGNAVIGYVLMNDLTKEELIAIHETYSWICEEFSQPDSDYAIKDKLQALIDN